jgi:hypothetical protein
MTSLKLKLHIGAVLAVTTFAVSTAHALAPGDYDNTVLNAYYSGASATDNSLENTFLIKNGGLCVAGSIGVYRVTAGAGNQRVVFCNMTAATVSGLSGPKKVAFHKNSRGGSSQGVNPLIAQTAVPVFDMDNAAACSFVEAIPATTELNGYDSYTCPDTTELVVPNGGISDVEPRLSEPAPTTAELAKISSVPGVDIIFGVPVSLNFFRALQVAQGFLADDNPLVAGTCALVDIDKPACMPSLSSSQIRGIYSGGLNRANQLFVGNGTATAEDGTALNAYPGVTPPDGTLNPVSLDDVLFICRRVGSSGTQASAEVNFFKQRCETTTRTFLGNKSAPATGTIYNAQISYGSGSANVRTCLKDHNTNGTWAVGVLSTEVKADEFEGFRFVKIDGAAPNIPSVMNGQYTYFSTNSLNRVPGGLTGAPSGDVLQVLLALEGNFGAPADIALANSSFRDLPWGDAGLLARRGSNADRQRVPDAVNGLALTRANPVNTQFKGPSPSVINNCNDAISIGGTSSGSATPPSTVKGTLVGP